MMRGLFYQSGKEFLSALLNWYTIVGTKRGSRIKWLPPLCFQKTLRYAQSDRGAQSNEKKTHRMTEKIFATKLPDNQ